MDFEKLKLRSATITANYTVNFIFDKLDDSGKLTLQQHRATIGPDVDVSEWRDQEKAIVESARIGYVKPE